MFVWWHVRHVDIVLDVNSVVNGVLRAAFTNVDSLPNDTLLRSHPLYIRTWYFSDAACLPHFRANMHHIMCLQICVSICGVTMMMIVCIWVHCIGLACPLQNNEQIECRDFSETSKRIIIKKHVLWPTYSSYQQVDCCALSRADIFIQKAYVSHPEAWTNPLKYQFSSSHIPSCAWCIMYNLYIVRELSRGTRDEREKQ